MRPGVWRTVSISLTVISFGFYAVSEAEPDQVPFIVNGWDAARGRWPWQVAIMLGATTYRQVCGAVLISPRFILSAAHCTQFDIRFYRAWVGGHDLRYLNQGQMIAFERIINHPKYNGSSQSFPNDISVVELAEPAILNQYAQPAVLPETGESFLNNECYISGWGKTDGRTDEKPDVLQEVRIPVISNSACRSAMSKEGKEIFDTQICVFDENRPASACQGDSGGPLQCRRSPNDPWVVAGITSWGKGDDNISCYQTHPSVYTRISCYINWIRVNTNCTVETCSTAVTTPGTGTTDPSGNDVTTLGPFRNTWTALSWTTTETYVTTHRNIKICNATLLSSEIPSPCIISGSGDTRGGHLIVVLLLCLHLIKMRYL